MTYVIDGEIAHHDTNGGGGIIGEGDTQWMTAGAGILHDELPTERIWREGGRVHAIQLWVNLPSSLKLTPARYQPITGDNLKLITSADGGALVRIIAGNVDRYQGPGDTHTPITYLHATISPGAELTLPWSPDFSAMAYVLMGNGSAGVEQRPIGPHQLALFGSGDTITVRAAQRQDENNALEVLVLGGHPIRQPISHYGPFVMNTRQEIAQAIEDYQTGRLGMVPTDQAMPRHFAESAAGSISVTPTNQTTPERTLTMSEHTPRIAVIYYSSTGTVYELAKSVVKGAKKSGAEVRLGKVHELAPEEAHRVEHRLGEPRCRNPGHHRSLPRRPHLGGRRDLRLTDQVRKCRQSAQAVPRHSWRPMGSRTPCRQGL